jgi:hypothetical protein
MDALNVTGDERPLTFAVHTHTSTSGANASGRATLQLSELRGAGGGAMDAGGYAFHLILAVQLHFLEIHFFDEDFGIEVGI